MSTQENKDLVRRFMTQGYPEVMRGNMELAHQYYADHFVNHTSLHPEGRGIEETKEVMADIGRGTPDLRIEVLHIIAEGDLVSVHWRATGTHQEQLQTVKHIRHVEPHGQEETFEGNSLYRVENGKLVEAWHYTTMGEYTLRRMGKGH